MFTGIIEEVGRVLRVEEEGNGVAITIAAAPILNGVRLGESIAVDGACQTVVAFTDAEFIVQAVATTLARTTLGSFAQGRRVNLERALALGDRLGGHMVQGHVDGVGEVLCIEPQDELVLIDFGLPAEVAPVTVLHGSITLNGISLTVNALPRPGVCQVSIIPHTWTHTALPDLRVGDAVNVEGDLIGKYVRRLLAAPAEQGADNAPQTGVDLRSAWGY